MTTLLVTQTNGADHQTPPGHPERPARLEAIAEALSASEFAALARRDAASTDPQIAELAHSPEYIQMLQSRRPAAGLAQIDEDTFISPGSFDAIATALGGGLQALEAVVLGEATNAFCAIRPPGHHAEINRPMGFCLVNNVAILAREAQRRHGADRVAIVDFDVHHGNGTQDIFKDDASVFYGSSHQMPLYPGTGSAAETGVGNIFNAPLKANTGGAEMRAAYEEIILPALEDFSPDLLLVSAGFDAHFRDPLAQLGWNGEDFTWVTEKLMDVAARCCENRLISLLEGGYDLEGLADGARAHVLSLMGAA